MTIPIDRTLFFKFCWVVNQQRNVEVEYARAKWRVEYYQKAFREAEDVESLEGGQLEIAKQVQSAKLHKLKIQEKLLKTRKRLLKPYSTLRDKLKAHVLSKEGVIRSVRIPTGWVLYPAIPSDFNWKVFLKDEIVEMANQYEAERALDRILTRKGL